MDGDWRGRGRGLRKPLADSRAQTTAHLDRDAARSPEPEQGLVGYVCWICVAMVAALDEPSRRAQRTDEDSLNGKWDL